MKNIKIFYKTFVYKGLSLLTRYGTEDEKIDWVKLNKIYNDEELMLEIAADIIPEVIDLKKRQFRDSSVMLQSSFPVLDIALGHCSI